MSTTVIEKVKGSELPVSWLERTKEKPEQIFNVVLKPLKEKNTSREQLISKWRKFRVNIGNVQPLTREEIYQR